KQYRATGSIEPKPYTGGPQPTLQAAHHEVLRELVESDNDATLVQLAVSPNLRFTGDRLWGLTLPVGWSAFCYKFF
ncbi:MAG: hypothetical protein AAF722_12095, partial [Cyanobacteria bacterium P01_C01_bin.70]